MKHVALLLVLLPSVAAAATINVNSTQDNLIAGDGRCTLREAIANVNAGADTTGGDCAAATGPGDTVTFSLPLPTTLQRDQALDELTIQRDVAIAGPVNATLRISGRGKTRVFEIAAGTTQMSGVTIQSGTADRGGGILVDSGASLNMTNCIVRRNNAMVGGGIYNDGGAVSLSNCTLTGNKVSNTGGDGAGGGMYNGSGTASLSACTLSRNTARGRGGLLGKEWQGKGGGIYNAATLDVTDCVLSGNRAIGTIGNALGGAGIYNDGVAAIAGSTFRANRATDHGGGLYNAGTLELTGSTLSGNRARNGAGFTNVSTTATLANCTLSGNRARNSGGGMISDGNATLTNCTITGNHAGGDGLGAGIFGNIALKNTIVANNTGGVGQNCDGGQSDGGHNLSSDGTCFFDGSGLNNTDPRLAPLGNYGGTTQTVALCTGPGVPDRSCTRASPAIDAGDDTVTGPPDNLSTDQRGLPRLSGVHVDIGAYEVQQ